jgi:protein-L-isoaspartate(D-aspartate) O-methyltransferase
MNFEQAHFNMVEQQIRPWDVLDQNVLDLLMVVKREDFVPAAYRAFAYSDTEIPLAQGVSMLKPVIEGQALQALQLKKHEKVLEVGTGSGYMAALLATHADQVISVEIDPALAEQARTNLRKVGIDNVTVTVGDGLQGVAAEAPFDVIMVSGGVGEVPQALLDQLKVGGRLFAIAGDFPVMEARLVTRVDEKNFRSVNVLETHADLLKNGGAKPKFNF